MANKRQEIVKHEETQSLTTMPAYLRKTDSTPAAGTENMERQDITLPRLGLCQALTPQRLRTDPKYIPGLEEGQFFNTITQQVYGDKVRVVPLLFYKSRLLFGPMEEGGGLKCRADDNIVGIGVPGGECAKCSLSMFGKAGEPPECNQLYNYASVVLDEHDEIRMENMLAVSFRSTQLKVARDWNALIRLRRADLFAGIYEFKSIPQKKDNYNWFGHIIAPTGWVSEQAYRTAQELYNAVAEFAQQGRLHHDVEDLSQADQGTGEGQM